MTPTITFNGSVTDNPTAIEMTLDVTFSDRDPASDTMKVYVYDDTCKTAVGSGVKYDPGDFNTDCNTMLDDFGKVAEAWLDDFNLTAPVEKP